MILQALEQYYRRKAADPENGVAPEGWEWKEIPFLLVLDREGRFLRLEDTREGEGKNRRAKRFLIPQGEKRTVGIRANLGWDNVEYVLGANPRGRGDVEERHQSFVDRFKEALVSEAERPSCLEAVARFLNENPLAAVEASADEALWKEILDSNAFLTFRVQGEEQSTVCEALRALSPRDGSPKVGAEGVCLVTGEKGAVAQLHPAVKGVRGANSTGAALVSFNLPAFQFYGKEQNLNAPVGESAAFAYTAALNLLLGKDSENKAPVGETTAVFWAEDPREKEQSPEVFSLEKELPWIMAEPPKDDPDRGVRAVRSLFEAVRTGDLKRWGEERFYLLGLSPNAARLSVRFWRVGTVRQFSENLARHFEDLEIVRSPRDPEYLTLTQLLRAIALGGALDNIPPNLGGAVVDSALSGNCYPKTLLQRCVGRIRAERYVSRPRAAILKACVNREARQANKKEALAMALDRTNNDVGYRLGRLFFVLEKTQESANPGINATIRDRYYGAASTSPLAVFSQLMKLNKHHLSKLDKPGYRFWLEKEIGEIVNALQCFPAHLTLEEQALFAVGYYHQRQDFYTKNTGDTDKAPETYGDEQA